MKEGLYKIAFGIPGDGGTGVGHLKDGRLHGGDDIIFYVGTYAVNGNDFEATVKTDAHSKYPGRGNIFGQDKVNIHVKGTVTGDVIEVSGSAKEAPGHRFQAKLTWLCD